MSSAGAARLEPMASCRTPITRTSAGGPSNADLREANLREANLREANLREANLREANL